MSKEQTSMNSGVTALMVKPLSKRPQLLSPSILTQAMSSGPLHWVSGSGFKKGTFMNVFRLWEPCLGMPVEQLLVSEGSDLPSLSSPLLHLNSLFWWSCWDPLNNLSQDGQDCHIWSNFVFFLVQVDWDGKTDDIPNWLICSTKSTGDFWVLFIGRLGTFCLLCLCTQVFCNSITFNSDRWGSKGMAALQLPGGKQVPFVEVDFLYNRTVDSLKTSFHPLLWTSSGLKE